MLLVLKYAYKGGLLMKKSKVNHDAVMAIAASAPERVTLLVERIRAVKVFADKLNVNVFDEREFQGFVRNRRDFICEVKGKDTTLINVIRLLSSDFRAVNSMSGNAIIAKSSRLSDEQIANELLKYLAIKAAETQQAEFERDEAKRASSM
jgi:hypothetical protein